MAVKIITDSTSDITPQEAAKLNLRVVPLTVNFGQEEFIDGVNLTVEDFYARLRVAKDLPKTSLVSPAAFVDVFNAEKKEDDLVVILISSELSGTYQSALTALDLVQRKNVHLIDSRQVTFGLASLVYTALKLRDQGKSAKEIVDTINAIKEKLVVHAVIDDLKYLKLGGRLSGAAAAVGTLLRLKPIISIADGKVTVVHKTLGVSKAFEWITHQLKAADVDQSLPQFFGHSDAQESVLKFMDFVTKRTNFPTNHIHAIGITVGTHAGPGAVGLSYFKK